MSLKKILERNPQLTLEAFQRFQKEYDRKFVDKQFNTNPDNVRHTYAYMGKLLGRLATYVESREEGHPISSNEIREKVIPDLLIYSAWLAGVFDVDMQGVYLKRIVGNIKRLHSDKMPPEELRELEDYVSSLYS